MKIQKLDPGKVLEGFQIQADFETILRGKHIFQADVFLLTDRNNGTRYILKDFHRGGFLRKIIGKKTLTHETHFYRYLSESPMICPDIQLSKDHLAMLMPYLENENVKLANPDLIRNLRDQCTAFIGELHAKGISNGDIRIKNILYHPRQSYIIDWATAIDWKSSWRKYLPSFISGIFMHNDRIRLHKCFAKLLKEEYTETDNPLWYKVSHFIRSRIYRPIKRFFRNGKTS